MRIIVLLQFLLLITQPAAITATTAITNVKCNGASTGSVVITPSGGVGPYTITPSQTGLAAGNYTFTVTDANNCSILFRLRSHNLAAITATTAITNVKCNGASTGSVVITPSGGGWSLYYFSSSNWFSCWQLYVYCNRCK